MSVFQNLHFDCHQVIDMIFTDTKTHHLIFKIIVRTVAFSLLVAVPFDAPVVFGAVLALLQFLGALEVGGLVLVDSGHGAELVTATVRVVPIAVLKNF